jgi:hypothetical protein
MSVIGIRRELCALYGQNIMSEGAVRQWSRMFIDGRTNVHDEDRSGWPAICSEWTCSKCWPKFCENALQNFRTYTLLCEIIIVRLGYHKFCVRWVPKILTDAPQMQKMALNFLEHCHKDYHEFLDHIVWVTGDKTWVSFVIVKPKSIQSNRWTHNHQTSRKNLNEHGLTERWWHLSVFLDSKRLLMVEFVQQGTTVTSEVYFETLKILHRAFQNKGRGMLTSGVVLLHDNTYLHTAPHTWALQEHFNWVLLDQPPYRPDFTLSDYHLLPTWRTGWDPSTSTIVRNWWKVSTRVWAHRRQTSLT